MSVKDLFINVLNWLYQIVCASVHLLSNRVKNELSIVARRITTVKYVCTRASCCYELYSLDLVQ